MSGQHTPAPWRVSDAASGMGRPIMAVGGQIVGWATYLPVNDSVVATQEANACLIAGAPLLLEALQGLLDGVPFGPGMSEYELVQAGCDPTDARKFFAAFDAIARARGETK